MNTNSWKSELPEIFLGDEELTPRQASPTTSGRLVVRGYVLDPDDDAPPRIALLVSPVGGPRLASGCATAHGRKWRKAAAQAASGRRSA